MDLRDISMPRIGLNGALPSILAPAEPKSCGLEGEDILPDNLVTYQNALYYCMTTGLVTLVAP
jgi:hypothetical protein